MSEATTRIPAVAQFCRIAKTDLPRLAFGPVHPVILEATIDALAGGLYLWVECAVDGPSCPHFGTLVPPEASGGWFQVEISSGDGVVLCTYGPLIAHVGEMIEFSFGDQVAER
jgi:hypothetical protein